LFIYLVRNKQKNISEAVVEKKYSPLLLLITFLFAALGSCEIETETAAPSGFFSIYYNGNGQTSGNVPLDGNFYRAGDPISVKGNSGILAKTGNTLAGWNTRADGSGTNRSFGSSFPMPAEDVILFARWTVDMNYEPPPPAGSLDLSFDPGTSTGTNAEIASLALHTEDRILISGQFTEYRGVPRNRLARLNSDGSLDTNLNPGTGANDWIYRTALQDDGKILIAGSFTNYNGTPRNGFARLNPDGTIDPAFTIGTGFNSAVNAMVQQPDGKIIVGGSFTTYDGAARNRILRLNSDGTLDLTFTIGGGANNFVSSIIRLSSGKILIAGGFTMYDGIVRSRIARLNSDGTLDGTFNPGSGANNDIQTMAIQPDGKIFVGGWFTEYAGTPISRIARLFEDGTLDPFFAPGSGPDDYLETVKIQSDGKILIGGHFHTYNETPIRGLARLNSNGSLDTVFDTGTGLDGYVNSLALQPDGKILIGGYFTSYNGTGRIHIARINP
jgi:uncharacterized delta-60 repeat protein